MGMPQADNRQLNTMLLNAAAFVHHAPRQAAQLQTTLTNVQGVIDRLGAVSSNSAAVQVREFTSSTVPNVSIQVEQIATPQRNQGTDMRADERTMPAGVYRFEVAIDGETHTISFTATEGMTNRAFQQAMTDAILEADIGITASITTIDNRSVIHLASSTTGASQDDTPRFTIRDTQGNAVEAMGVGEMTHEGQNAIFTIDDGEPQESATNDINLGDGLEVTLRRATEEPVTFSPGRDSAGMRISVRNMVSQFNALLETARENSADIRTRQLIRELESVMRRSRRSLQEIGVTMNPRTGLLEINETALTEASESDAIERFLGESESGRRSPFIAAVTRITDTVRTNPTRHISPHAARFPTFHLALNAVANGNTLANEPHTPFDAFMLNDMVGSLFNTTQ